MIPNNNERKLNIYRNNSECKKELCPFHQETGVREMQENNKEAIIDI
jgi:hypothetical protein